MSLLLILLILPFGALHFLPTIIALGRGARSVFGIFLLNLLLGWTVVGWVVALVWALRNEPKWQQYGYAQGVRRF